MNSFSNEALLKEEGIQTPKLNWYKWGNILLEKDPRDQSKLIFETHEILIIPKGDRNYHPPDQKYLYSYNNSYGSDELKQLIKQR